MQLTGGDRYLRQLQRALRDGNSQYDESSGIEQEPDNQSQPGPPSEHSHREDSSDDQPATRSSDELSATALQTPVSVPQMNASPEPTNPLASATTTYVSDDSGRLRKFQDLSL